MPNIDIFKDIVEAVKKTSTPTTQAYDTPATVTRIEGDVAWVHIPGGVDETPVRLTIAAKAGDTVQLRVGGGTAWLVGNQSAPPTDDTRANEAIRKAKEASGVATDFVTDTKNGIFVHPKNNTADGVRITDSIDIIKGKLSFFRAWIDGELAKVRVGREDAGHTDIDSNGMRVYGGDGTTQLANIGYGEGNDQEGGTETEPYYSLGVRRVEEGDEVGNYSMSEGFETEASGFASHAENYYTSAKGLYSHAEGRRATAEGDASHAEGSGTVAKGVYSHAEGIGSVAKGAYSHAENGGTANGVMSHAGGSGTALSDYSFAHGEGTVAGGNSSAALGSYNAYSANYLFAVGSGADTARKNAFTVGKSGNAYFEGRMMSGNMENGSSGHAMFAKGTKSETSASVASGGTDRVKIDITSDGYIPVAIGGTQLTNSAFTFYTAVPITEADPSGDKHYAVVNVKNNGSAAGSTGVNVHVLYIATSAL